MKVIAFYLPQFHRVLENDKWWGEGYTEWTAVKKAIPLYEGHYQPHEPLNKYYYNLLQENTMQWQSEVMHTYGIDGMCFYHYWFGEGKKVLEKPAENLLNRKDINMPFCFSWANESWVNSWEFDEGFVWNDIENKEKKSQMIFEQKYGREDEWDCHLEYLIPFFEDERYIRIEGKPALHIYRPELIPCLEQMLYRWRRKITRYGFDGLYILGGGRGYNRLGVDKYLLHEPSNVRGLFDESIMKEHPTKYSYRMANEKIIEQKINKNVMLSAFCSYDNTPRYGKNGVVFDSSPSLFEEYLSKIMAKNEVNGCDITFVDAWNEWAEGMHLEPDTKYAFGWLQAIVNAKKNYQKYVDGFRAVDSFVSEAEERLYSDCSKADLYYRLAMQWIELKESKNNVSTWFKKKGIKSVIIYGYTPFARILIDECSKNNIRVEGILDQRPRKVSDDIVCYGIEDDYPYSDCIVVTPFFYMRDIYMDLVRFNRDTNVYSLREIIMDCTSNTVK